MLSKVLSLILSICMLITSAPVEPTIDGISEIFESISKMVSDSIDGFVESLGQEKEDTSATANQKEDEFVVTEQAEFEGGNWVNFIDEVEPDSEGVYKIYTPEQLAWVAWYSTQGTSNTAVNRFSEKTIRLMDNIDLSAHYWIPIGGIKYASSKYSYNDNGYFKGTFDGQGHTITGLTVESNADYRYYGLFGCTNGAIIEDVGLKNVSVQGALSTTTATYGIGALVGYANASTIQNCFVRDGSVSTDALSNAGGLVGTFGSSNSTVTNCYVQKVSVSNTKSNNANTAAGGIVGYMNNSSATVSYSYFSGSLTCTNKTSGNYMGGIVGRINTNKGKIVNSYTISDYPVYGNNSKAPSPSTGAQVTEGDLQKYGYPDNVSGTLLNANGIVYYKDYEKENNEFPVLKYECKYVDLLELITTAKTCYSGNTLTEQYPGYQGIQAYEPSNMATYAAELKKAVEDAEAFLNGSPTVDGKSAHIKAINDALAHGEKYRPTLVLTAPDLITLSGTTYPSGQTVTLTSNYDLQNPTIKASNGMNLTALSKSTSGSGSNTVYTYTCTTNGGTCADLYACEVVYTATGTANGITATATTKSGYVGSTRQSSTVTIAVSGTNGYAKLNETIYVNGLHEYSGSASLSATSATTNLNTIGCYYHDTSNNNTLSTTKSTSSVNLSVTYAKHGGIANQNYYDSKFITISANPTAFLTSATNSTQNGGLKPAGGTLTFTCLDTTPSNSTTNVAFKADFTERFQSGSDYYGEVNRVVNFAIDFINVDSTNLWILYNSEANTLQRLNYADFYKANGSDWGTYLAAYYRAETVLKGGFSQAEIDTAYKNLRDAILGLKGKLNYDLDGGTYTGTGSFPTPQYVQIYSKVEVNTDSNTVTYGEAIVRLADYSKVEKDGYECVGWTATKGQTTTDYDNNNLKMHKDSTRWREEFTIFAAWKATYITITLNQNGGSGGTTSIQATNGAALPNITVPTRTGYTFAGYFADGATATLPNLVHTVGSTSATRRVDFIQSGHTWNLTTAGDKGRQVKAVISVVDSSLTAAPRVEFNDRALNSSMYKVEKITNGWEYTIDFAITEDMVTSNEWAQYETDYRFLDFEGVTATSTVTVSSSSATLGGNMYYGTDGKGVRNSDFTTATTLTAHWYANLYYLNVNGMLDGVSSEAITGYGTVDIFINGEAVARNRDNYWVQYPYGSTYEVKLVSVAPGKSYLGLSSNSAPLSGTIDGGKLVRLEFESKKYTVSFDTNDGVNNVNLFYPEKLEDTVNGITYSYSPSTGIMTLDGTSTKDTVFFELPFDFGTGTTIDEYKFSYEKIYGSVSGGSLVFDIRDAAGTSYYWNLSSSNNWTTRTDTTYTPNTLRFRGWYNANSGSALTFDNYQIKIKLEKSDTATAYTPIGLYATHGSAYGSLPTPTRIGYTFDGWYTEPTGGTQITNTTVLTTANNHTLYAHWTANEVTYTLYYNNGRTEDAQPKTVTGNSGTPIPENALTATPPDSGYYTFNGWYQLVNGNYVYYEVSDTFPTSDVTLYAAWKMTKLESLMLYGLPDDFYTEKDGDVYYYYTKDSKNAVLTALATAQSIYGTDGVLYYGEESIATVDNATSALATAIDELKYNGADYSVVDNYRKAYYEMYPKADVEDKYENETHKFIYKGKEYDVTKDVFTYGSFQAFESAVKAVVDGKDITEQADVNTYAAALADAYSNLTPKKADYTEFEKYLDLYEQETEEWYTEETWEDLSKAIQDNEGVDRNLTALEQGIVDDATSAIKTAYNGLKLKGADFSVYDEYYVAAEDIFNESEIYNDEWYLPELEYLFNTLYVMQNDPETYTYKDYQDEVDELSNRFVELIEDPVYKHFPIYFDHNNETSIITTVEVGYYESIEGKSPQVLPTREGYNFIGWFTTPEDYEEDGIFGELIDFENTNYIMSDFLSDYADGEYEITLYARWKKQIPEFILSVKASGGRVNVTAGELTDQDPDEYQYRNENVVYGTAIKLVAEADGEESRFLYWLDVGPDGKRNRIVSYDKELVFVLEADWYLEAVFGAKPNPETNEKYYTVTFVDTILKKVIETQTIVEGGSATVPVEYALSHGEYTFNGWNGSFDNVREDRIIQATYVYGGEVITITTKIGDKEPEVATYKYNSPVVLKITESEVPPEMVFAGWSFDGGETIVSYDMTYKFYAYKDMEIRAVFKVSVEVVPTVTIETAIKEQTGTTYKAEFMVTRSVPEGYTFVSSGLLLTQSEKFNSDETLTFEAQNEYSNLIRLYRTVHTTNNGQYQLTVKTNVGKTFYARGFVVYIDTDTNKLITKYTDVVVVTGE